MKNEYKALGAIVLLGLLAVGAVAQITAGGTFGVVLNAGATEQVGLRATQGDFLWSNLLKPEIIWTFRDAAGVEYELDGAALLQAVKKAGTRKLP